MFPISSHDFNCGVKIEATCSLKTAATRLRSKRFYEEKPLSGRE
jgi:hypothetical protein